MNGSAASVCLFLFIVSIIEERGQGVPIYSRLRPAGSLRVADSGSVQQRRRQAKPSPLRNSRKPVCNQAKLRTWNPSKHDRCRERRPLIAPLSTLCFQGEWGRGKGVRGVPGEGLDGLLSLSRRGLRAVGVSGQNGRAFGVATVVPSVSAFVFAPFRRLLQLFGAGFKGEGCFFVGWCLRLVDHERNLTGTLIIGSFSANKTQGFHQHYLSLQIGQAGGEGGDKETPIEIHNVFPGSPDPQRCPPFKQIPLPPHSTDRVVEDDEFEDDFSFEDLQSFKPTRKHTAPEELSPPPTVSTLTDDVKILWDGRDISKRSLVRLKSPNRVQSVKWISREFGSISLTRTTVEVDVCINGRKFSCISSLVPPAVHKRDMETVTQHVADVMDVGLPHASSPDTEGKGGGLRLPSLSEDGGASGFLSAPPSVAEKEEGSPDSLPPVKKAVEVLKRVRRASRRTVDSALLRLAAETYARLRRFDVNGRGTSFPSSSMPPVGRLGRGGEEGDVAAEGLDEFVYDNLHEDAVGEGGEGEEDSSEEEEESVFPFASVSRLFRSTKKKMKAWVRKWRRNLAGYVREKSKSSADRAFRVLSIQKGVRLTGRGSALSSAEGWLGKTPFLPCRYEWKSLRAPTLYGISKSGVQALMGGSDGGPLRNEENVGVSVSSQVDSLSVPPAVNVSSSPPSFSPSSSLLPPDSSTALDTQGGPVSSSIEASAESSPGAERTGRVEGAQWVEENGVSVDGVERREGRPAEPCDATVSSVSVSRHISSTDFSFSEKKVEKEQAVETDRQGMRGRGGESVEEPTEEKNENPTVSSSPHDRPSSQDSLRASDSRWEGGSFVVGHEGEGGMGVWEAGGDNSQSVKGPTIEEMPLQKHKTLTALSFPPALSGSFDVRAVSGGGGVTQKSIEVEAPTVFSDSLQGEADKEGEEGKVERERKTVPRQIPASTNHQTKRKGRRRKRLTVRPISQERARELGCTMPAYLHVEANWGDFFPSEWVWAQGHAPPLPRSSRARRNAETFLSASPTTSLTVSPDLPAVSAADPLPSANLSQSQNDSAEAFPQAHTQQTDEQEEETQGQVETQAASIERRLASNREKEKESQTPVIEDTGIFSGWGRSKDQSKGDEGGEKSGQEGNENEGGKDEEAEREGETENGQSEGGGDDVSGSAGPSSSSSPPSSSGHSPQKKKGRQREWLRDRREVVRAQRKKRREKRISEGRASFVLTGGKFRVGPLALSTWLVSYRSENVDWIFRTTDGDSVTSAIDVQKGVLRIEAKSRPLVPSLFQVMPTRRRLMLTVQMPQEGKKSLGELREGPRIFYPTPEGFKEDPGCVEAQTAVAEAESFIEDPASGRSFLLERCKVPLCALEFGGELAPVRLSSSSSSETREQPAGGGAGEDERGASGEDTDSTPPVEEEKEKEDESSVEEEEDTPPNEGEDPLGGEDEGGGDEGSPESGEDGEEEEEEKGEAEIGEEAAGEVSGASKGPAEGGDRKDEGNFKLTRGPISSLCAHSQDSDSGVGQTRHGGERYENFPLLRERELKSHLRGTVAAHSGDPQKAAQVGMEAPDEESFLPPSPFDIRAKGRKKEEVSQQEFSESASR
uniref:Transmembrane protein n=1 Tax=Chromera velia CCMP2878 TaxID=1169474 RepID=A0A0G4H5F6_9ALVE|eukprot:Cvel_24702.t1-p1 / transcript=Cvel_24702.t1 / gene=Cvel_24702 / organism=Chromera_velia_CCMP2878 / gene_product=hypothetical protein / transcript_product=hypothetical protein / location=Cvel_scaffold2709:13630-20034(-) / protein_length=1589 / sequence_SO=supercontig / SO=protein_coding / is_pseudo=false